MLGLNDIRIAVVGLGYVGLPLALALGRHFPTVGFDINKKRIEQLNAGIDVTNEASREDFEKADKIGFTAEDAQLAAANFIVVTVPTPIDEFKRPDFGPLISASRTIGRRLTPGAIVVYESTVYPGATEEVCIPLLEQESNLRYNHDFFVGYSPERINPGDREHRLDNTPKIISGSTPQALDLIDQVYRRIVTAGTHRASCLKVAEAAKAIENTQRDVNIALVNELALIFEKIGIDTQEVIDAAGTKWNFLKFQPGLVGGHCIGVDPYYLTHKAQAMGYQPEMILAGRRINDNMGRYVTTRVIKMMIRQRLHISGSRVLVMGFTFKQNCPDFRNTRVVDIVDELHSYGAVVDVYDPWVDKESAHDEYGLDLIDAPVEGTYDAIIVAVAHSEFAEMGTTRLREFGKPGAILFDVKCVLPQHEVDGRL